MSYNLFLDDYRSPNEAISDWDEGNEGFSIKTKYLVDETETENSDWVVVKNAQEFKEKIDELGIPAIVSFDHDLNWTHMREYIRQRQTHRLDYSNIKNSGVDCAIYFLKKWIKAKKPNVKVFVHSANHLGRKNIREILKEVIK